MTEYIFYFLSALSILSGLMVVFSRNPIYSVLYLVLCFFSIAGHYVLLNAQFLAIVHIIVYAGAIMVLFLFVIMMLNLNATVEPHKPALFKLGAVVSGGALMLILLSSFQLSNASLAPGTPPTSTVGSVEQLGQVLFNEYLFPFEISSVLFISAMVGAIVLTKKDLD